MNPFSALIGRAAPLPRADVDTDTIIPQSWLMTTERTGLGGGLFAHWRFDEQGLERPDFVLNDARFRTAEILVAGANYGCGSSREHAVWAHLDFGIRVVLAPSFGAIFRDNALKNGLVVVDLPEVIVTTIMTLLNAADPPRIGVDLSTRLVLGPDGQSHPFDMDDDTREALMTGRDPIAAALAAQETVEAFERSDRLTRPWVWDLTDCSLTGGGDQAFP